MTDKEHTRKDGYNEIEIQDDFSADVHPLYSKGKCRSAQQTYQH